MRLKDMWNEFCKTLWRKYALVTVGCWLFMQIFLVTDQLLYWLTGSKVLPNSEDITFEDDFMLRIDEPIEEAKQGNCPSSQNYGDDDIIKAIAPLSNSLSSAPWYFAFLNTVPLHSSYWFNFLSCFFPFFSYYALGHMLNRKWTNVLESFLA